MTGQKDERREKQTTKPLLRKPKSTDSKRIVIPPHYRPPRAAMSPMRRIVAACRVRAELLTQSTRSSLRAARRSTRRLAAAASRHVKQVGEECHQKKWAMRLCDMSVHSKKVHWERYPKYRYVTMFVIRVLIDHLTLLPLPNHHQSVASSMVMHSPLWTQSWLFVLVNRDRVFFLGIERPFPKPRHGRLPARRYLPCLPTAIGPEQLLESE